MADASQASSVEGKVVAITGASGGVGEEIEQPTDVDVNEIVIRPTAQA